MRQFAYGAAIGIFAWAWSPCALAQLPEADRGRQACATLPESNEALLLTGKIDDAIRAGEHRLAIELIAQIMKLPAELVASPGSRTYQPVWRHANRIIAQLPEPALQMYRQLYDAEAAAQLAEAVRNGRVDELWRLFRVYPHVTCWPEIGRELTARLLDEGKFAAGVEILSELLAITGDDAELRMQLIVATVGAGAQQLGERTLAALSANDTVKKQARWESRLAALKAWMDHRGGERGQSATILDPFLAAGDSWSVEFGGSEIIDRRELADAIDTLRRLPLLEPVIADDTLILRSEGAICGFDPWTLARKWKHLELRSDIGGIHVGVLEDEESPLDDAAVTRSSRTLLTNYLQHCAVAGFGHVYTIEGQSSGDLMDGMPRRPFQILPQVVGRSELVARSLQNGTIAWRTGVDGAHALADAAFQDRPLLLEDRLIAPYSRNNELRLAVLDPQSGRLIQDVSVVGPPLVYSSDGGRCLLTMDAANIFVSTGNGVIAALSQRDLSWQWACTYSSSLTQQLAQNWWQPQPRPVESGIDRPIVADNLLVAAPLDTTDVFGIDRFSGREKWRFPRRECIGLVGVIDQGLVVAGNGLTCLDISDPEGRPPRWRTVGLDIVGRPLIDAGRIFVPTRTGIAVVDAKTGKLIADEWFAKSREHRAAGGTDDSDTSTIHSVPGNLLVAAGGLFCASADRIVRFPDIERTRSLANARLEKDASDPRAAIALSWVDQLIGNGPAALERLQALQVTDSTLNAARDRLLGQVFVDLARNAGTGEDRLALLRRAASMTKAPEAAARLAAVIGDTLEKEGRWADAIAHYGDILAQPESRLISVQGETGLTQADWLPSANRLRKLFENAPRDITQPELEGLVTRFEGQTGGTESLLRLLSGVQDANERLPIQRALMRLKLPPDLLIDHLVSSAEDAPEIEKRRAHLIRWETHVGLFMLAEAAADQALWKERFAASVTEENVQKAEGDLADQLELDRKWAMRVERKQREFTNMQAKPFAIEASLKFRRWRVQASDLLMDSLNPLTAVRNWLPIRSRADGQIQVIETGSAGSNWLQTPDFVGGKRAPDDLLRVLASSVQIAAGESRIPSWSMKSHGPLGVVPVPGGIVCIGLAPGPTVRKRAWEFAIPQWSTSLPREVAGWIAAGPNGVYLCPRADRVAMLNWSDGRVRWQREFPGVQIGRIACIGERLLLFTQDRQVLSIDASSGGSVLHPPPNAPSANLLEIVADSVIAVSPEGITALDSATLAPRWVKPIRSIGGLVPASGASWLACQVDDGSQWRLIDTATGEPVFESAIAGKELVTALAFDGERLLVSTIPNLDEDGDRSKLDAAIVAFDPKSGKQVWKHAMRSLVRVNATQLLSHPNYIPILIDRPNRQEQPQPAEKNRDASAIPAIELISRTEGKVVERFRVDLDERRGGPRIAPCEPMLITTPTRMIVQIDGDLIGYGNPPASTKP